MRATVDDITSWVLVGVLMLGAFIILALPCVALMYAAEVIAKACL